MFRKRLILPGEVPFERHARYRRIPLRGTYNCRDLGGYTGSHGRHVRWGKLYRSDHLHNLKQNEFPKFRKLALSSLIDLRSEAERERIPNKIPSDSGIRIVHLPVVERENPQETVEMGDRLRAGDTDGIDPRAYLLNYYAEYATTFTPEYRQFMHVLLEAQGKPVLFHCTAGKDRTGFASAITLRLLGVSQEDVLDDYMLTNRYTRRLRAWLLPMISIRRGFHVARIVHKLMLTQPEYLETAFSALKAEYGTFENYAKNGLELDDADLKRLREYYLE